MFVAGGDGFEGPRGRVRLPTRVAAPADDGVVGAKPTRVVKAAARNGFEGTRRRVGLLIPVVAPADDGVIGAQPTRAAAAGGDDFEGFFSRVVVYASPADDGVIGSQPTRVPEAGGDSFVGRCGGWLGGLGCFDDAEGLWLGTWPSGLG